MTDSMRKRDTRCHQLTMCELRWNQDRKSYVGLYPWNKVSIHINDIDSMDDQHWDELVQELEALAANNKPKSKYKYV